MTLPQIISLVATSLLTVVAIIIGVQIMGILKDLKVTLSKLNNTLDSADEAFQKISQPLTGIFAIIEGFKQSSKIVEMISGLLGSGKKKKKPPVNIDDDNSI